MAITSCVSLGCHYHEPSIIQHIDRASTVIIRSIALEQFSFIHHSSIGLSAQHAAEFFFVDKSNIKVSALICIMAVNPPFPRNPNVIYEFNFWLILYRVKHVRASNWCINNTVYNKPRCIHRRANHYVRCRHVFIRHHQTLAESVKESPQPCALTARATHYKVIALRTCNFLIIPIIVCCRVIQISIRHKVWIRICSDVSTVNQRNDTITYFFFNWIITSKYC